MKATLFSALLIIVFSLTSLQAQSGQLTGIFGSATDQSGNPVGLYQVNVAEKTTGYTNMTGGNPEGNYSFQSLPAGTYTLNATSQLHPPVVIDNITVLEDTMTDVPIVFPNLGN